jgi:glycosyltransferase involved in cell wall biosynthesis
MHVITRLGRGGAPMMLYKLIRQSLAGGRQHTHIVVTLLDENHFEHEFRTLDIEVITLWMKRGLPSWLAARKLSRLLSHFKPDLVHGWMYHANIAASISARRECPVTWSIHHSLDEVAREKPLTRLLIRHGHLLQSRVSRIVYCSKSSRSQHELIGYPTSKGTVIPNGFDCVEFRPDQAARYEVRAALELGDDNFVIGHLARFHPMKNHDGLLEAFALVRKHHPAARLVMAGMGIDNSNVALVKKVNALGIAGNIRLLGTRKDTPRLMNAFDGYVSSSSWGEAFPVVLGEAMASGLPCVATDLGDSAEIIGDTGIIVAPNDSRALSDAIAKLIEHGASARRNLGAAARQRILDRYSLETVERAYSQLYEEEAS